MPFTWQPEKVVDVTYWFTMGDYVAIDRLDRLLVQIRYSIQGYIPDGFLFTLSIIENSLTETDAVFSKHIELASGVLSASNFGQDITLIGNK